jgi:ribosomal protein S18 acetylase RimI-like enzyme
MPTTTDSSQIRAILNSDRTWSAYALGDLSSGFSEQCEWHVPADHGNAVLMIFRGLEPPILFAHGDAPSVERLVDEIGPVSPVFLHVRPGVVPIFQARYQECKIETMWRMVLDPSQYCSTGQAVRLGIRDLQALRRLYSDGDAYGEAPDYFAPSMLSQGVYFGIWEGQEIMAAAGTHLIAPKEGVGAVGNVYTRRDRRGRGHAASVTSGVTSELLRMKLPTVVLSVNQRREGAIRLYERLGYTRYCIFCEGVVRHSRKAR